MSRNKVDVFPVSLSAEEFPKQQSKEYFDKLNQLLTDNGKKFSEPLIYEYDKNNIVFPLIRVKEWDDLDEKYSQVGLPKIISEIVQYFQRVYMLGKEVSFKVQVGRYGRTDHMYISPPSSKYIYRYILNLGQREIYYLVDPPRDTVDEEGKPVLTFYPEQPLRMKPSVREFDLGDQFIVPKDNIVRTPYPFSIKGLFVSDRYKQKIIQPKHFMLKGTRIGQMGNFFLRPNNYHRITLIFDVSMNIEGTRYALETIPRFLNIRGNDPYLREGIKQQLYPKLGELLEKEMENEKKKEKYLASCDKESVLRPDLDPENSSTTSGNPSDSDYEVNLCFKLGDKVIPLETFGSLDKESKNQLAVQLENHLKSVETKDS